MWETQVSKIRMQWKQSNLNEEISKDLMAEKTFVLDLKSWLILNGVWYMVVKMGIDVRHYAYKCEDIPWYFK